jgi:hypothetical protein
VEGRQGKLEVVRRVHLPLVLTIIYALAASPSGDEQGGTATGHLTLNGKRVALAHAYASAQPGFFDKNAEDLHVLLSDVPLTADARDDRFALIQLARDGRAHIVEVVINAAGTPISGAIFAKAFGGMVSVSGMHEFAKKQMDPTRVVGRLSMDGPRTFMEVTYQYDARFAAPIPRPPTADEIAAALATPPAKAATAYLAAIRQGLTAFLGTLDIAAAADYRGADGAARFKQLQADMPADARVVNLTRQPDGTALAIVEGHQDGIIISYTLTMVQVRGAWKVGKGK